MDDQSDSVEELSAADADEFAKKDQDAKDMIRELEQQGWQWQSDMTNPQSKMLVHPNDPEISVWFDPYSAELLLSPKYVDRIKESVRRDLK